MRIALAIAAIFAVSFSFAAFGQSTGGDEPVYDIGGDVSPPRVIRQVNPKVPDGAQGFRISGSVLIGLIVTSDGDPMNVHVVRSLEKEVDEAAVAAVREWQFDPAHKAGQPVAVRVTVEVRFHDM